MTPQIEQAIYGLVSTPVLHLVDRHDILTCLIKNGPLPAGAVADQLGLDGDTVQRLLLVCVAFGVVRRDPAGAYRLTEEALPLFDRGNPRYIGGFVEHLTIGAAERMQRLEEYLRRGKAEVDATREGPYDIFYRDEESTREFMDAMWHLSHGVSKELAALADLPAAGLLVDAGGANGPFAAAALQQSPGLRAVVFDLPPVRPHLIRAGLAAGVADRLDFVAGDFFTENLPPGDLVSLGYVMSNWPDEECLHILRNAYRACAVGGRVLVMDRLFADDHTGPLATSVMNLLMQLETRGRHRTVAEYLALLTAAGFTDCTVRRSTGDKHLIIGHKAGDPRDRSGGDEGA
ncbi:methyltransferase [Micromonospora sp. NPDC048871]|uniref:methyltransferase n=1 Tax=unclassified Micromonospora TaxID=2617518 RepID=UPI002E1152DA|nr:acetylserotonin O-methyltransferase [Micromonospora sp. NBC_01739]